MNERLTPLDPKGVHGIEHLLGINGIKTNPDTISLDPIRPVVEMSMGGHALIHDPDNLLYHVMSINISGASAIQQDIIVYGNLIGGLELVYRHGYTLRLIALDYIVHVEIDAGAVTPGKTYSVAFTFREGVRTVSFYQATHDINNDPLSANSQYYQRVGDWLMRDAFLNAGGVTFHQQHAMGSGNQIRCPIVPPTWGVQMNFVTNCMPAPNPNHFNFPAGSFAQVSILAQQVPWGAPIPAYW